MQKKCASIIFVHSGESPPPEYLTNALVIAAKVAPQSQVYALVNKSHVGDLERALQADLGDSDNPLRNIKFVAIEDIPQSDITKHFAKNAALDRSFRNGFWFSASYRFFVLADFIHFKGLENCIHLENDVVLYFDPSEKLEQFISFATFAVPVDRVRAIPGIVWLKDASIASELVQFIADRLDANDMDSLGAFAMRRDLGAKPLPTIPLEYAKSKDLDLDRYCQGIDVFGGIFDGAAIGQYVGGVHWMNDPSDTRFFENESSDFHLRDCRFSWEYERFYRSPFISFDGVCTKVLALHAHSKDLLGVSPFNSGVPSNIKSMLTGERIQALADLTISSAGVTAFHGREKIQTPTVLEITEKEEKKWFKKKCFELPPNLDFLKACQGAKVIFVYTHLLAYFKSFVAPRLHEPFVLLTHNSDHGVGLADLDLLNHPSLVAWYAQNCETSHTKLHALPIGLANSQWGPTRVSEVFDAGHVYQKTKNLYVNFSASTHSARQSIIDVVSNVPDVTMGASVGFEQYITQVAEHRFCLCPRGNGIDTHRFWEAQYVDTIPVLLKQDWTSAYSNLPVLLVDAWEDLLRLNWEEDYIRRSTSNFDRKTLTLEYYRQQLLANI
ncbi:glycosyltransferase family 47 protein [Polynucleobacter sp. AP-RePozz3-80-G7]|uniref:glycosyltransferase family 47 protein n=1 Tax=Polynucleobacter sp. AP-RePozz3-80-G7 TaxID=2689105 RepID=UPI001C0CB12C|nr:glycosyltransferase family 47 protein [Polynucleobacter sp. AP-RePozz3-80-G7]MBU3638529.1 hypothetical protein [Polynucleobacter sp. AP-RePozz3-80-G7]